MSNITIRTGSEGPKHDPYGFTEINVERPHINVVHHSGLGSWTIIEWPNGRKATVEGEGQSRDAFERHIGMSPERAEKAYHELKQRRVRFHKCGTRKLHWVSGYPGEELLCCGECGIIIDSTFDRSAVE